MHLMEVEAMSETTTIHLVDLHNSTHAEAMPKLLNEYCKNLVGFQKELDPKHLESLVPGLIAFGNGAHFLAEQQGEFVGFAICFFGFSTFQSRRLLNIHDIGVLPSHQGMGVGRALITAVCEHATREGCCKVTLETQSNNTGARRFYERNGFTDNFLNKEAGPQLFLTKLL
jgi:ribosomal protein S18 acetylase RimI-like enzyme